MTGDAHTEFQRVANSRGWKFSELAERWGLSERQLSRIARAGKQRDIDAVNGLPNKQKKE